MIRALLILSAIAAVSAHITMFPTTAVVGQRTYVYAQVPHSCDEGNAPNTIGLAVRIPTNLTAQPMTVPGYNLTRSFRTLSNGHQQLDWVTWTSTTGGFPTWQLTVFPISVTFPAAYYPAGRKVWFQILQYCDGVGADGTQSNWTAVANPTTADDLDLYFASVGEVAPGITVTAAQTVTTYVNTTTYQVVGGDSDDWTQDSTIAVIALILAALSWVAWFYTWCNTDNKKKKDLAAAPPATPSVAGGSFVAAQP